MKPTIYKFITEAGDVYAVSARDFAEYSEHIEPTLEDLRALRLQHHITAALLKIVAKATGEQS